MGQKPDELAEWIKFQLRLKGYSLSRLARELGVGRHTPKKALYQPYPRMEAAIAERLDTKPQQIWPERYDANGKPNRPMGRPPKPPEKSSPHGAKLNTKRRQPRSRKSARAGARGG